MHAYNMHVNQRRPPMLIVEHTIETTATTATIWGIWANVANWNSWDHGIEFATLNGPFQKGSTGTLKPKGGPLVHTTLTSVIPLQEFVDESKLPLTKIIVSHFMSTSHGKTHVTHRIEMRGMLSWLFAFLIGRTMKRNLPQEMASMIAQAENL